MKHLLIIFLILLIGCDDVLNSTEDDITITTINIRNNTNSLITVKCDEAYYPFPAHTSYGIDLVNTRISYTQVKDGGGSITKSIDVIDGWYIFEGGVVMYFSENPYEIN